MRSAATAALLAVSVAGVAIARPRLEPEASALGRVRDPAWLPSGRLLRTASLGQRLLLADLYWLRTVMYVGESALAPERGWSALLPLGTIVTDLDPRYGYAYQVIGSNLSGLAHDVAASNRLLEKGMANVPDRWGLPFLYAYNKFFYEGDFGTAAAYARRAAEIGHRPHLALLAANLSLAADSPEQYQSALAFLEITLQQTDQPEMRAQLEERIGKVKVYASLSSLEHALRAFHQRSLRWPLVLEELVWKGLLPALPAHPPGGAFEYDAWTGAVRSSTLGPRQPLKVTQ